MPPVAGIVISYLCIMVSTYFYLDCEPGWIKSTIGWLLVFEIVVFASMAVGRILR